MKRTIFLVGVLTLLLASNIFGQLTLPRESQRLEMSQSIGDVKVSISLHRPNVKGRKIFGCATDKFLQQGNNTNLPCLVPYGQVWRTGANEATVIEFSGDVTINEQKLPKGKYSLHTIPGETEWTIIFSKNWGQWGSFTYDAKDDALRVTAKPVASEFHETMSIEVENVKANSADFYVRWDKISVPFTVNVGDVNARLIEDTRRRMINEPVQLANFVLAQKMTGSYQDALSWVENSIKIRETFGNLNVKARLLAELGKKAEAIATAEKAIQVGKASTPPANPNAIAALEGEIKKWKGE
jgi:hypothetical protein